MAESEKHLRDKSIKDFINDFGSLKPSELWALLAAVTVVLSIAYGLGHYIGAQITEHEVKTCKLALERRTQILRDIEPQLDHDSQKRVRRELSINE